MADQPIRLVFVQHTDEILNAPYRFFTREGKTVAMVQYDTTDRVWFVASADRGNHHYCQSFGEAISLALRDTMNAAPAG